MNREKFTKFKHFVQNHMPETVIVASIVTSAAILYAMKKFNSEEEQAGVPDWMLERIHDTGNSILIATDEFGDFLLQKSPI